MHICILCCVFYYAVLSIISCATLHYATIERSHHYHNPAVHSFSALLSRQHFTGKSSTLSQPCNGRTRTMQPPATTASYSTSHVSNLI